MSRPTYCHTLPFQCCSAFNRNKKASTVPKQVPHTAQPPGTGPDVETEACGHTCVLWEGCHSEGAQGDNAPEAKRAVSAVARSAAELWGNWVCQQAGRYQHAFLIHVTSLNPLMDPMTHIVQVNSQRSKVSKPREIKWGAELGTHWEKTHSHWPVWTAFLPHTLPISHYPPPEATFQSVTIPPPETHRCWIA